MRLRAEASIDIDANRKIWISGFAEDVSAEDAPEISKALTESVTEQALSAHEAVGLPVQSAEALLESIRSGDPADRRPRPEDPESMRAFGDD
jgi:hypothetical protein